MLILYPRWHKQKTVYKENMLNYRTFTYASICFRNAFIVSQIELGSKKFGYRVTTWQLCGIAWSDENTKSRVQITKIPIWMLQRLGIWLAPTKMIISKDRRRISRSSRSSPPAPLWFIMDSVLIWYPFLL